MLTFPYLLLCGSLSAADLCVRMRYSRALLVLFDSAPLAVVVEGGDGVVDLAIAHQMDIVVGVLDEAEEEALHLHERLTVAAELYLAGRVDFDDLLGFYVQDNPVRAPLVVKTTQDADLITANLAQHWDSPRRKLVDIDEAPGLLLCIAACTHLQPFN